MENRPTRRMHLLVIMSGILLVTFIGLWIASEFRCGRVGRTWVKNTTMPVTTSRTGYVSVWHQSSWDVLTSNGNVMFVLQTFDGVDNNMPQTDPPMKFKIVWGYDWNPPEDTAAGMGIWGVGFIKFSSLFSTGHREVAAVNIHYWLLTLLTALPPVIYVWRARRSRRQIQQGLCTVCGYDLRASKDRCPECGRPVVESSPSAVPKIAEGLDDV